MKTYIVAIFNHLEGNNKLHVILAKDEIEATKKAIIENAEEKHRSKDYIDWVEGLGDTMEEVVDGAHQGELAISNVISI